MLALLDLFLGRAAEAAGAFERAAEHARRAGDRRLELDCLEWINGCLLWGPAPAQEAIRRSRRSTGRPATGGSRPGDTPFGPRSRRCWATSTRHGSFASKRGRGWMTLGMRLELAGAAQAFGWVELLAGDPVAAEREFRAGYELSERMGETGYFLDCGGLAEALYAQRRDEEALHYTKEGERQRRMTSCRNISGAPWAKVPARRGERNSAEKFRPRGGLACRLDGTPRHTRHCPSGPRRGAATCRAHERGVRRGPGIAAVVRRERECRLGRMGAGDARRTARSVGDFVGSSGRPA